MIREAEENLYMSMSDVIDPPLHLTISLPGSTPLRSFLGGVCAAFPVHALLYFNNNTFGISSFIHGAAHGRLEDVLGLVLGGVAIAVIEKDKPTVGDSAPLSLVLSGLLVGAGSKVGQLAVTFHAGTHVIHLLTMHR
jgi:hypothetical protein